MDECKDVLFGIYLNTKELRKVNIWFISLLNLIIIFIVSYSTINVNKLNFILIIFRHYIILFNRFFIFSAKKQLPAITQTMM